MSFVGGALSVVRFGHAASLALAALLAASSNGCVRDAVLENDVRSAQWRARTLATAADPYLARAALSAELVELEALYQRSPDDLRVTALLDRGYLLMARGFLELDRLQALSDGDAARQAQAAALQADAESRARYYRRASGSVTTPTASLLESLFADAEAACARRDRQLYERSLNGVVAEPERGAEQRLELALSRRKAALWLESRVAARCQF